MLCSYRFHHYDCLVMPTSSLASIFPWEKVGLLVEFEELKTPLFPGGPPRGMRLQEYIALRAVREVSASALAGRGRVVELSVKGAGLEC